MLRVGEILAPGGQEVEGGGCVPEDDDPGVEGPPKARARCVSAPELEVNLRMLYVGLRLHLQHDVGARGMLDMRP